MLFWEARIKDVTLFLYFLNVSCFLAFSSLSLWCRSLLSVECLEQLLPAVTAVINQSLQTGVFPSVFKEAIVKPLPKKPSLDPNSLKNYRPVSNLFWGVQKSLKKSSFHNSQHTSTLTTSSLLPNQPIGQGTVLKPPGSIWWMTLCMLWSMAM